MASAQHPGHVMTAGHLDAANMHWLKLCFQVFGATVPILDSMCLVSSFALRLRGA